MAGIWREMKRELAQLVAHLVWDQGVECSSHLLPTRNKEAGEQKNYYFCMTLKLLRYGDIHCNNK